MRKTICIVGYLSVIFGLMPFILIILYMMSLFYLYSNPHITRELTIYSLFFHMFIDLIAVSVVRWNYVLWNIYWKLWCDKNLPKWLNLFGLLELVIYFILIGMNGFFDRLSVDNWYLKPIIISFELILFAIYFGVEVRNIFKREGVVTKNENA